MISLSLHLFKRIVNTVLTFRRLEKYNNTSLADTSLIVFIQKSRHVYFNVSTFKMFIWTGTINPCQTQQWLRL